MTRVSLVTREEILTDTQGKFCNALLVPFIQPVITANVPSKHLINCHQLIWRSPTKKNKGHRPHVLM